MYYININIYKTHRSSELDMKVCTLEIGSSKNAFSFSSRLCTLISFIQLLNPWVKSFRLKSGTIPQPVKWWWRNCASIWNRTAVNYADWARRNHSRLMTFLVTCFEIIVNFLFCTEFNNAGNNFIHQVFLYVQLRKSNTRPEMVLLTTLKT
jgi:hypothetical protein